MVTSTKASIDNLLTEQVPNDSRHARQLVRRQQIAEMIMSEGSVRIEDLTERFAISLMTAHRDVDELVSRGLFRKSRGIVSAAPTSLIEASDLYRVARQSEEKKLIAEAAMQFVEPGQAIFLDDSTTVLQMVPYLADKGPLTVITNSLILMNEVRDIKDVTLLGLGGQLYNWCNAFVGGMTIHEIRRLRADVVFISIAAITDDLLFHQSPEMVETKRAMLESSAKRVLLTDHTKFERRALHNFGALKDFDVVIVDDKTSLEHVERMQAQGINVVIAGSSGTKE
ncbi:MULTISPECIES: DeoR/GlpR family DNA-binding transcription regulator [unclassified Ochrobactrum]|uniref:DeoR/GlpR family DNA-binding transcription regulator n=1 Tax=unclassified Ochrobactrum TaxID=239106 RepID=UPI0030B5278B